MVTVVPGSDAVGAKPDTGLGANATAGSYGGAAAVVEFDESPWTPMIVT
jgi:hypothetical protein